MNRRVEQLYSPAVGAAGRDVMDARRGRPQHTLDLARRQAGVAEIALERGCRERLPRERHQGVVLTFPHDDLRRTPRDDGEVVPPRTIGDVVTAVNGMPINAADQVSAVIGRLSAGEGIITVDRHGTPVTLRLRPRP